MATEKIAQIVARIIREVEVRGDSALCQFARRFDGVSLKPKDLRVSKAELEAANAKVSPAFLKALQKCAQNIRSFAESEKKRLLKSWIEKRGSARVGQLIRPVDSAGLYIPGGRFPYPSTVLMTAIPARIAGVRRIILASPPKNLTPEVLAAAAWAGINEVYRMGGAGAIAAMAYGTHTIPRVDFIVGPGNRFVTEAKRQVYGKVGIDSLAGPSEVVVIADDSADPDYVEVDLMAQAEHDSEARACLVSSNKSLIETVKRRIPVAVSPRITFHSVRTLDEAIEFANTIAPEHLELLIRNPERCLPKIRHAGAIFLGPSSPAAIGDYVAGPSHVLPTQRAARFSSGLSVATFMKRSSVIGFQANASERAIWEAALTFAQTEGMEQHALSLRLRLQKKRRAS